MRSVPIAEQPDLSGTRSDSIAPFPFESMRMGFVQVVVKPDSIGLFGHSEESVPQGPPGLVQFHTSAPGISASVRRVIPCAIVHQRPIHKLRARIMAVAVVVENIVGAVFAEGKGEA